MGGSKGGLNCTARAGDFEPNGDIVGIGVLVAFFATAAVTVGAIIFGYLSDSFPESYLNDLDRLVVEAYKKTNFFKAISWLSTVWRAPKDVLKLRLGLKLTTPRPSVPPEVRQEALSRFLLTLSDQQLVTGLAILIGAVSNQRILSVYEFSVVLSLAWFSSTTHLATLDALREYFLEHEVVRNWRVGGMLGLFVLLSYCLFTTMFAQESLDPTVPVQCYFSPQPNPLAKRDSLELITGILIASTTVTLMLVLSGYIVRIRALYIRTETAVSLEGWLVWRLANLLHLTSRIRSNYDCGLPKDANVEVAAECQSSLRLGDLKGIMEASAKSKWKAKLRRSSYQYDDSFLSSISGIAFSFSYGIAQVVSYRWVYGSGLTGNASAIDFGQITPLFLLVLPVLAAAEIYYESRDIEKASASHHKHTTKIEMKALPSIPSNQHTNTLTPPAPTNEAQKYEEHVPAIKKYLYREIEEIRKLETAATTPQEHTHVLQRKTQLLSDFEGIQAFEQSLELSPSIIRFIFNAMISILLGVLLNISSPETNLVASAVFVTRLAKSIVDRTHSLDRYMMTELEVLRNQAADREFFKQRDGGGVVRSGIQAGGNVISSGT